MRPTRKSLHRRRSSAPQVPWALPRRWACEMSQLASSFVDCAALASCATLRVVPQCGVLCKCAAVGARACCALGPRRRRAVFWTQGHSGGSDGAHCAWCHRLTRHGFQSPRMKSVLSCVQVVKPIAHIKPVPLSPLSPHPSPPKPCTHHSEPCPLRRDP